MLAILNCGMLQTFFLTYWLLVNNIIDTCTCSMPCLLLSYELYIALGLHILTFEMLL